MKYKYIFLVASFFLTCCANKNLATRTLASEDAPPFKIYVKGSDAGHFVADVSGPAETDPEGYDAVIIGGGLSGLSASVFLTDQGMKVLLLEKQSKLGGLAFGGTTRSGIKYDRGAAYWTDTYNEEQQILTRIGLKDFKTRFPITEPADSFLWNGKLYKGIWEAATLNELPASFKIFYEMLKEANDAGLIGDQPIENHKNKKLDLLTATQWIQLMPKQYAMKKTKAAIALYEKYKNDQKILKQPMSEVLGLLNLYCRSALGSTCENVSALAFANFYISEIETRYTTQTGTNGATQNMQDILDLKRDIFHVKKEATVGSIEDTPAGVIVRYKHEGQIHEVHAKFAVYAAQLKFAPQLIKGLNEKDPSKVAAINALKYSHYSVHDIFLKGHPFRSSYDTWVTNLSSTSSDFTDFILGRWQDPVIKGYEEFRDFKKDPPDNQGIITIYHPLSPEWVDKKYDVKEAKELALAAIAKLQEILQTLPKSELPNGFDPIRDIDYVETNRWPFSVHVPQKGHFLKAAPLLRRHVGHIYFANNNIGTPAFEEALFRGHCAADNILLRVKPGFKFENWPTKCPVEK